MRWASEMMLLSPGVVDDATVLPEGCFSSLAETPVSGDVSGSLTSGKVTGSSGLAEAEFASDLPESDFVELLFAVLVPAAFDFVLRLRLDFAAGFFLSAGSSSADGAGESGWLAASSSTSTSDLVRLGICDSREVRALVSQSLAGVG